MARRIPTEIIHFAEWILLILVALLTILSFKIFSVNGVLLEKSLFVDEASRLHGAIIGRESGLALILTFASVIWRLYLHCGFKLGSRAETLPLNSIGGSESSSPFRF